MLIQGLFDPIHVLREFLLCEYAFSIHWKDDLSIRIAHRKGVWTLAKMKEEMLIDFFAIYDNWDYPNLYPEPSGLIRGFLLSKKELCREGYERTEIASAVCDLLPFWAKNLSEIETINIVQPGRNASIDEKTGLFNLSPRKTDWKK